MAELDEIVQKVMLDGDVEILKMLSEIGEKGFETFKEVAEAAEHGASKMELFGSTIGAIAIAFVGAVGAITAFIEAQDDAIQKTNFLAESFGATTAQIMGIEAAFAAAGVSTSTFEQFAQRLITTIARDWPQITAAVRTSATQQEAAQERIQGALLRVQEAQRNLGNVNAQEGSKIANANLRVEQTFIALQFAAAKAASEAARNYNNVRGAALALESAEQRLAELQGRPVSDSEKKALEIKQATLAVDNARQAQADARTKQQQQQAEAVTKQAQIEQAHADAQLKRNTLIQESQNARAKAELSVKEAITQRAEAEEKASQQALKDIPTIAKALTGIKNGNLDAAKAIDVTKVATQDLVKGLILASSSGIAGKPPDGIKVMSELSKTLKNDTNGLIDTQQRLALVQQIGSRSMSQTGASVFELLHALERGPEFFNKFSESAKNSYAASPKAKADVEHFKDALESLTFAIQTVNRNFAAAASPVFTDFLHAIEHSLTASNGTLKYFVDGVQAIGQSIGWAVTKVQEFGERVDHAFHAEHGRTLQVIIVAITVAVAAFASAWLAIPAAIALVVTAVGYLAANWDNVKKNAQKAWDAIKDTTAYKILAAMVEKAKQLYEWLGKTKMPNAKAAPAAASNGPSEATEGNTPGYATGGEVHGPGTGTSDSILARLSAGEFVVTADAVAAYGTSFFHSLNAKQFPGYASGGLVSAPSRLAGGGSVAPQSVLNLSIDGQTFGGLRGSKSVVDSLAAFAVGRQTASAGRRPGWNK